MMPPIAGIPFPAIQQRLFNPEKKMSDALTYAQRFQLGVISIRRESADMARQQAVEAALRNDLNAYEMLHAEADRHEAAIVAAVRELTVSREAVPSASPQQPLRIAA